MFKNWMSDKKWQNVKKLHRIVYWRATDVNQELITKIRAFSGHFCVCEILQPSRICYKIELPKHDDI